MKNILIIFLFILPGLIFADATDEAILLGRHEKAFKRPQVFQPEQQEFSDKMKETFSQYEANPDISKYYATKDASLSGLKNAAKNQYGGDEIGKMIKEIAAKRDQAANKDKALFDQVKANAKTINDNAFNIIDIPELEACFKSTNCTTNYTDQICLYEPKFSMRYCSNSLEVTPYTVEQKKTYTIDVWLHAHKFGHIDGKININTLATVYQDKYHHSDVAAAANSQAVPVATPCDSLIVESQLIRSNYHGTNFGLYAKPTCTSPIVWVWGESHHNIDMVVRVKLTYISKTTAYKDNWNDQCPTTIDPNICTPLHTVCIAKNQTRIINGENITRDCWQKETVARCAIDSDNKCNEFIHQGCQLVQTQCETAGTGDPNNESCSRYAYTYRCPVQSCAPVNPVCKKYCPTGYCDVSERTPDADYGYALSRLGAVLDASKDWGTADDTPIYSGQAYRCITPLAENCQKGEIGQALRERRTAYVGHYWDTTNTIDTHVYCVFPSKIARIMQEQIKNRSGASFGEAEAPNCAGVPQAALTQSGLTDLAKLDLTEYEAEFVKEKQASNEAQDKQDAIQIAEARKKGWEARK